MAECKRCKKWGLFLRLKNGLCADCCKDDIPNDTSAITTPSLNEPDLVIVDDSLPTNEPVVAEEPKSEVKQQERPPEPKKPKKYRVTGMSHHMDNIMRLAVENSNYSLTKKELIEYGYVDERIWKNEFYPVSAQLEPEPDNPVDPKAIKVIVDGEHVGYIKSGSCSHLLTVIRENRINKIDCEMFGGPYKYVHEEYDYERGKSTYTLDRDDAPYGVHLLIDEA